MAEAIFVQDGECMDHTPSSGIAAGDVVLVGSIPCVAKRAIATDQLGAIYFDGIFDVLKDTSVFSAGDAVYWNATGTPVGGAATGAATSTAAGAYLMGVVVEDAATGDTTVR
ncbi:MAG TPA: DUF2190 family protein, partial [Planctomycetota bacterium]|nr:DUF2190 family protein [Planctomycetota bacterium]